MNKDSSKSKAAEIAMKHVEAFSNQEPVTLLAARHYIIDENEKIKNELVIISNYEGKV